MRGVTAELGASLKKSAPIGDALTKGELREEDVVRAFRHHIPQRYELVKAVIVNSAGDESDPQDIVLLDTSAFPAIVVYGQELVPGRVGMISGLFYGLSFGVAAISAAALGMAADAIGIVEVYRIIAFLPAIGLLAAFLPKVEAEG